MIEYESMYRQRTRKALNFVFISVLCLFMVQIGPKFTINLVTSLATWGQYLGENAKGNGRAWVDLSYVPRGRLRTIRFRTEKPKQWVLPFIWVQIWTAQGEDTDDEVNQYYVLKWQQQHLLNHRDQNHQIVLSPRDAVEIGYYDKMGWSTISDDITLAKEFDSSYGCLFYNFGMNGFPKVSQNYTFDGLVQPYRFSIELDIDQV